MSTFLSRSLPGRLMFVDQLKGFAIFLVVLGHIYNFALKPSFSYIPTFIGMIHMPVFMFVAGLMFHKKEETFSWAGYYQEMVRKFKRVLVPFISIVFGVCVFGGWDAVGLMMNEMKYGYWFVYTLFMLYAVFYPFLYLRAGRKTEVLCYLALSVFLLVSDKYILQSGGGKITAFSRAVCAVCIPFLIGHMAW